MLHLYLFTYEGLVAISCSYNLQWFFLKLIPNLSIHNQDFVIFDTKPKSSNLCYFAYMEIIGMGFVYICKSLYRPKFNVALSRGLQGKLYKSNAM